MLLIISQFSHQFTLVIHHPSLKRTTIEVNNLEPSQFLNRYLPSLPFSPETQHFPNKFKFQYSDVTYEE